MILLIFETLMLDCEDCTDEAGVEVPLVDARVAVDFDDVGSVTLEPSEVLL